MKLKQISLFVENKPGTVNSALKLLADNGINISTLSLSDSKFFGVLRLLIRDWEKARDLLESHNFAVKITDVVAIEVDHAAGSLSKVLEVLLPLLESRGIAKLIMESRFPSADAKDAALYRSMRKKGLVSAIDIDFANPAIEHRLWVPDQILGAFSDTTLGLKPSTAWQQEWDALKGGITVIEAKP